MALKGHTVNIKLDQHHTGLRRLKKVDDDSKGTHCKHQTRSTSHELRQLDEG